MSGFGGHLARRALDGDGARRLLERSRLLLGARLALRQQLLTEQLLERPVARPLGVGQRRLELLRLAAVLAEHALRLRGRVVEARPAHDGTEPDAVGGLDRRTVRHLEPVPAAEDRAALAPAVAG